MASVTPLKNKKTKERLQAIFTEATGKTQYHILYGYSAKRKLFQKQISSWVLGYKEDNAEIVAVHIRFNGEVLEKPLYFNKDNVNSVTMKKQQLFIDAKNLLHPITIRVPAALGDKSEMKMLYPIAQTEQVKDFFNYVERVF